MKLFFISTVTAYDLHEVTQGYWGSWKGVKLCPAHQAICGVNAKISESKGLKDDTGNNALKFKCCSLDAWGANQGEFEANQNKRGEYDMFFTMCDFGTFVTGMDALLQGKQGKDDDTAMGGVKIICDSYKQGETKLNTHRIVTRWGSWVKQDRDDLETVQKKTLFCGASVRVEED